MGPDSGGGIPNAILTYVLAATSIVKVLIDLLKMNPNLPGWSLPMAAVVFGILAVLLLMASGGEAMSAQHVATAILAGILSGGSAAGVTALGQRADRTREEGKG